MDNLTFLQLNLHNSYKAQDELENRISEIPHPSICFIQEPPTPKKKVKVPKKLYKFLKPR